MAWLSTFTLVLAVSLDSLGVGFAYGLKKVTVPPCSLILLSLLSALSMLASMLAGRGAGFILGEAGSFIGNGILIMVGVATLGRTWLSKRQRPVCKSRNYNNIFRMIANVIAEPLEADLDASGEISTVEALLLGFVLAMDSLGAGFGAALAAFSPVTTSLLTGLSTWITLNIGLYLGRQVKLLPGSWVHFTPGFLLICLGMWRFWGGN
ncbi:MAG: sporulation membrane protein YtaF [Firmicutes bacterium]|nr:sporulation membrane protein YtaF [Bacillota bacterium]